MRRITIAAVFLCLLLIGSPAVLGQFGDLTRRVPDGTNAILLIDVQGLKRSPLATREGWSDKHAEAYQAGLTIVPPGVNRFVGAAQFDFNTMTTRWEMALMNMSFDVSIPKVAKRYQGSVDRIAGRQVAVLPGNFFAVRFGPSVAAVGEKSTRQDVARWIRRIDNNSLRGLSPYLQQGQEFAEQSAHVILAMDLTDTLSAESVEYHLKKSAALEGVDVDTTALAQALASVRGIKLGITVTDQRNGALRVDFDQDVSALDGFAKPLLLEALARRGVAISELENWEASVSGKRLEMRGVMEQSGMRRLLSLLDTPPSLSEVAQTTTSASADSTQQLELLASQTYFKAVNSYVDDLRGRKQGAQTMGQVGVWFQNYARRIDRLPILNVHPDLLDWGRFVADSLREGQAVVQDSAGRSRVRQQQVPEQFDVQTYAVPAGVTRFGIHGWGGWTATPNLRRTGQLRSQVRTQERIRSASSTNALLQHIDAATAEIRRHMTAVFSAPF